MTTQLPIEVMKKAVKGMSYLAHPLRLRILERLDIDGASSVSTITKELKEEQVIVSQSLKKLREANLVKTKRKGIFIYYDICEEYPASIFVCIRKLFGYMTNDFRYLDEKHKALLPKDYTTMVSNRIKLFANFDKMRLLEYLLLNDDAIVSDIVKNVDIEQVKVSQYLKKMRDDGFVTSRREGRFVHYSITLGVHKTALQCIHNRYYNLKDNF